MDVLLCVYPIAWQPGAQYQGHCAVPCFCMRCCLATAAGLIAIVSSRASTLSSCLHLPSRQLPHGLQLHALLSPRWQAQTGRRRKPTSPKPFNLSVSPWRQRQEAVVAQADAEEAQKTLSRPGTARRLDMTGRGRTPVQTGRFATPERLPRPSQPTTAAGLGPQRSQSAGTHLQSPLRQASGRQAGRLEGAGGSLMQGPWRAGTASTLQASPPPSPLRVTHGRGVSTRAPAAAAAAGRTGSQPQSYSAWQATAGQGSTQGRAAQSPLRTRSAEGGEEGFSCGALA